MICGLPPALSATDSVPVRAPEAVGVKVTLIVQFPPAAKVAGLVGQALAPVLVVRSEERGAGKESSTAAGPEFDSVTVIGALVAASNCLPRSRQMRSESESRAVPCPLSLMICGLPPALSATDSVPVRAPKDAGVKVTLIVQFPLAAKVAGLMGQALAPVLVVAKSPEAANELIVKGAAPVFVSVTVIGVLVVASNWLPKARLVGANPTPGAESDPKSVGKCERPQALSPSDSVPVRAPKAVGVKVTLMVQFPPAAKVAGLVGQALAPVLVAAKSPEAANELIVKSAAPVFVSVTVIAVLVVVSSWLPKARLVGANPTPGAEFEPVPPRLMFCGLFTSSPVITSVTASVAATDGVKVTLTLH